MLSFALLCFAMVSYAQQNVVKLGLGSAFQQDLNLKYERTFAEKHSFQIAFLGDFPQTFNPLSRFGVDSDDYVGKLSGFAVVPEYRYYFSAKGAPRGFYAGAYLKYRQRNLNFTSDFGTDLDIKARARLQNFGIGLGCGVQFLISDRFAIDWNIVGLGYNQFFASASVEPLNEEDFDELKMDLQEVVEDLKYPSDNQASDFISEEEFNDLKSFLGDAIDATESQGFKTGRYPFGFLDFRTGVSVGYAF